MDKFLPVGIQNFEQMIKGNFIYVDKTRYIHEMVRPPQGFYFLARPRRFGKSLTISTLDCLFQGRQDLFKNLYISHTDWQWKTHPVIKIDFSTIGFQSDKRLERDLLHFIERTAMEQGVEPSGGSLAFRFSALITDLVRKYKQNVAVLIDEYDKPIIHHLGKGHKHLAIAKGNREKLKQFFGVLKGGDVSAALRFVFITGISKFARVSIFSDLNNLNDISMHRRYSAILGYTQDELVSTFEPCLKQLGNEMNTKREILIDAIRKWYDGYRFTASGQPVYNPFSIVNLFDHGKFGNYWFETATPSFLVNLIREKNYPVADIEQLALPEELFNVYELDRLQLEPLLFQTGYITIDKVEDELYYMRFPNEEVRMSFSAYLFNDFTRIENAKTAGVYKRLHLYLRELKMDAFIHAVQSIMGSIPYTQCAGRDEAYFHTVFFLMLSASGVSVHPEVLTRDGRIDIAIEFDDKVFIMELKCDYDSEKAVKQILAKQYYEKYLNTDRQIYLVGINFDSAKRTVDDWQWGLLDEFRQRLEK